ncbi:MAG TPA: M3 family metallopeptidase, partial [Candidatus Methylomirabilis sp.]|nr:M3 family metallopeptidase [Candidatus Methylomirabilis sp.]
LTGGQRGIRSPEAVLVCNFPRSEPGAPGLLQPDEVEIFFHEFGHLMHHVFGGHQRWAGISGIRTEWDFVEVPSMLLQELALDPPVLRTFARHHVTGEPLAGELAEGLRAARDFGKGLATRRQMFLAAVSLDFHRQPPGFDTTARLAELQEQFLPFRREHVEGTYFHLAFGHLEGYSAAYYTYLWSEVIARDLLTGFEQEGLLSPGPARRLRATVLAPGGSKTAAQLVRDFLGREYSFDAFARWMNAR